MEFFLKYPSHTTYYWLHTTYKKKTHICVLVIFSFQKIPAPPCWPRPVYLAPFYEYKNPHPFQHPYSQEYFWNKDRTLRILLPSKNPNHNEKGKPAPAL